MRFSINASVIFASAMLSSLVLGAAIPSPNMRDVASPLENREARVIGWEKGHEAPADNQDASQESEHREHREGIL